MRLHHSSVATGILVAAVAFITMAQMPQDIRDDVRVQYGPHPRTMVVIREGISFVVPPGRLFVLTALGGTQSYSTDAQLLVNGQIEVRASSSGTVTMKEVPQGFTVDAGSTIEVTGVSSTEGRAWGYMARR